MKVLDVTNTEVIDGIQIFASLPGYERDFLAQVARIRNYATGSVIFHEGEISSFFAVLLAGKIEIVKGLGSDGERVLSVIENGATMGEMSLFFGDRRRSASGRAITPVSVCEIPRSVMEDLLKRQPELMFELIQTTSHRFRNAENDIIGDLRQKNRQLEQALDELKAAQEQLLAQERLETELATARRIQESLLPKELPQLACYNIQAFWQPARVVSGDFYDFIPFPDGKLGIVVGDVTDKGVPAALVMATTRAVLRASSVALSMVGTPSPGAILSQTNDLLCPDIPESMFITCMLAILDPASGHLHYANAGHMPPYQCSQAGVQELRAKGMPLGILPGHTYIDKETVLEHGETLFAYSDAIIEAHDANGTMYGFPRLHQNLEQTLKELTGADDPSLSKQMITRLLEDLSTFTGPGWEQEDDITMVTIVRC